MTTSGGLPLAASTPSRWPTTRAIFSTAASRFGAPSHSRVSAGVRHSTRLLGASTLQSNPVASSMPGKEGNRIGSASSPILGSTRRLQRSIQC